MAPFSSPGGEDAGGGRRAGSSLIPVNDLPQMTPDNRRKLYRDMKFIPEEMDKMKVTEHTYGLPPHRRANL